MHTLSVSFLPDWLRRMEARLGPLRCRVRGDRKSIDGHAAALLEGDSDFVLTYAHPAVAGDLGSEDFEVLVLATETILPVSAPGPGGAPLFRLPGTVAAPLPVLGYTGTSFLGRCMTAVAAEWPFHLQTVHEDGLAEGLRGMALQNFGIAWLPARSLARDIAAGRLVEAGDGMGAFQVEIRLVRSRHNSRRGVQRLWAAARSSQASRPKPRARPALGTGPACGP